MSDDSKKENNIEEQINRISNNFESDILRLIKTQSMIRTSEGIIDDEVEYLKSKTESIQAKLNELNLKTNELSDLLQVSFQDKDLSTTHVGIYLNEFIASLTKESSEIGSLNQELTERLESGSEKLNSLQKFYVAELEAFQSEVDSGLNVLREDIKIRLDTELEEDISTETGEEAQEPAAETEESIENEEDYYQKMFLSGSSPDNEEESEVKFFYIALGILLLFIIGFAGYYFNYLKPDKAGEMVIIEDFYTPEPGEGELNEPAAVDTETVITEEPTTDPIQEDTTETVAQGNPEEYILTGKAVAAVNKDKDEFNSKVLVKRANIRSGPGKSYGVVTVITYGTQVAKLDEESGIWTKIRLEDGKEGWVAKKLLSK